MRDRQLRARDMLRGDLEGEELERYVEERVVMTTFEKMLNWARANSIFPLTFGLACCAIEAPISIVTARYDLARFGAEALRASPRQADLIILSGRVSIKMAPVVRRLYDQMLEPKWAISMGACSSSGGHVLQLRRRPGRRQVHADRPPRPRLPAAAGGGPLRLHQAAAQDHGQPRPGLAPALRRRTAPRSGRAAGRAANRAPEAAEAYEAAQGADPCLTPPDWS